MCDKCWKIFSSVYRKQNYLRPIKTLNVTSYTVSVLLKLLMNLNELNIKLKKQNKNITKQ